ncbi:Translin [Gloeopeniophorella convolvens]|nr:Translin [Gloeopeniophorella convolvens]
MDPRDLDFINTILEDEARLKESIREHVAELEKKTRVMAGILDRIHSTPRAEIPALLDTVRPVIHSCQAITAALAETIPRDEVWRWKDLWTNTLRTAAFSVVLVYFLADGTLAPLSLVAEELGIKEEWKDRFALTPEDYLHGVITVINELSRLVVNAVTLGDFEAPLRVSVFAKEVFAGFTMLNLKNDLLRRRFDSLKYDIKKIEEVIYDVSLRKLVPPSAVAPGVAP